MYNWLKNNELFWKGYFSFYFGKKSFLAAKEYNKKKKFSWKERTKRRFEAMKENEDGRINKRRTGIFKYKYFEIYTKKLDIRKDKKIFFLLIDDEIWEIIDSSIEKPRFLTLKLRLFEKKETKIVHFENYFRAQVYNFSLNTYSQFISHITENEELFLFEIIFDEESSLKIGYSRVGFDLLLFFRRKGNRKVLLTYYDACTYYKIKGWEYN